MIEEEGRFERVSSFVSLASLAVLLFVRGRARLYLHTTLTIFIYANRLFPIEFFYMVSGFLERVCMCLSVEKTRILLTKTMLAQRARNFRDAV